MTDHADTITDDLAARMYPSSNTPPRPAPASAPEASLPAAAAAPTPADPPLSIQEVIADVSEADRLYLADAGAGTSYEPALRSAFDSLEASARYDDRGEDLELLSEGRREAASLLEDWRVPDSEAREVALTLGAWHGREAHDDATLDQNREATEAALRSEWGRAYDANVRLAQQAAADAITKVPWLSDLLEAGAGNQIELVKAFQRIGLRNARRARNATK